MGNINRTTEESSDGNLTYVLYNKQKDVNLIHPTIGLWFTHDLKEAKQMHKACLDYLEADGLEEICKDIIVRNYETHEEISFS